ncbi:MAG: type II toxin-antitoxin system RelE/ParE family toxin [Planctomycetes bacterium]|nr:type II toxin-antitoxin system RelE/ParE family toxin [Planctomycetota bacterium]
MGDAAGRAVLLLSLLLASSIFGLCWGRGERLFGSVEAKVPLAGSPGYRVRVGDYRILYAEDDSSRLVRIYRVRHRGDAYRDL